MGDVIAMRFVAALVIAFNLWATLSYIRKARASRPPMRIDDTIITSISVVVPLLLVVLPLPKAVVVLGWVAVMVLAVFQWRRVRSRVDGASD